MSIWIWLLQKNFHAISNKISVSLSLSLEYGHRTARNFRGNFEKKKSEERKQPKREEKLKMGKDNHRTVFASLRGKRG